MKELLAFYAENYPKLLEQLLQHLHLTLLSVLLACSLSIPLGIYIVRQKKWAAPVLNAVGILQTIPSIALLGFLIPILGIGIQPAIFALFLYSLLPIVRNVYTGIREIDPRIIEAAHAMGMRPRQVLFKIELPLAMPTLFAGIRTATVINVGVATLAAYIAAGGLGEFIFGGIALNNSTMIIAGALPAALLAVSLDFLLGRLQKMNWKRNRFQRSGMALLVLVFLGLSAFSGWRSPPLKAGFAPEFTGRPDGLPALRQSYALDLPYVMLGPALMYKAIKSKEVDVISGYSTDGRIKAYDLRVLTDDRYCFPPYEAAWLMRGALLSEHPELEGTLNRLTGTINDSLMTWMNYQVDEKQRSVREVARSFLESRDLYRKPRKGQKTLVMGSKIFTEQYILTEIYKQLIEGFTDIEVDTKKGLGGTKICLDALLTGEIDLYPEYSGTALQVILKRNYQKRQSKEAVFGQVQKALKEEYHLWMSARPGFNNTYALMMREEQAETLGIQTISGLKDYKESLR